MDISICKSGIIWHFSPFWRFMYGNTNFRVFFVSVLRLECSIILTVPYSHSCLVSISLLRWDEKLSWYVARRLRTSKIYTILILFMTRLLHFPCYNNFLDILMSSKFAFNIIYCTLSTMSTLIWLVLDFPSVFT